MIVTSFFRPVIENDNILSVYRLTPLLAIVNNEQFIYSYIPNIIAVNTQDQSVMTWTDISNKNECLFSIFIYCSKKLPFIRLNDLPCLSELLDDSKQVVTSCEITRSHHKQTDFINFDNDVWLFSHNRQPMYCQLQTDIGRYNGFTIINEPSILRLPCGNTLSCSDMKLTSFSCTNRNVLIKSSDTEQYVQLQTIPWSLKNMNKQLISVHQSIIKNSFKTILDDLKENRLSIKTLITEFGEIGLSAIFLIFALFISLFVRWTKRLLLKRIERLENNLDDLLNAFATRL